MLHNLQCLPYYKKNNNTKNCVTVYFLFEDSFFTILTIRILNRFCIIKASKQELLKVQKFPAKQQKIHKRNHNKIYLKNQVLPTYLPTIKATFFMKNKPTLILHDLKISLTLFSHQLTKIVPCTLLLLYSCIHVKQTKDICSFPQWDK